MKMLDTFQAEDRDMSKRGSISHIDVLSEDGEKEVELIKIKDYPRYSELDMRLLEIEQRIADLEGKSVQSPTSSHPGQIQNLATESEDWCDSLKDVINLLRSSWAAKLQIIFFLICAVLFLQFG